MPISGTIEVMSSGAGLAMSADGRLAVVKQSGPGAGATRLRHEAEVLRRAAHPGVVELIDERSGDDGTTLTTVFVGGGTLREHMGVRCDLRLAARVAAVVAATLADLHDRGIAHGRLAADHVLVGAGGQAVVCGWAEAILATGAGAGAATANADVAAMGVLLRELAEGRTTTEADALRRVGDRALATDPAARPSMRSLVAALRALVPEGIGSERPGPV
ncbi:MAG: protein kinase, partial [Acidimicrobiales bacterium]